MIYGSVCSGIEAASVAWRGLGWQAAWFAEIEPFPCAVLAHHYPNVPNLGDMTKIAKRVLQGKVAAPDVLVGGTPCQAYSVAGLREGLDDPRGQLTLSYMRLADAIDFIRRRNSEPECIIVWENVPGVLSDKTNAFGCFLAGLAGENCELQPPRGKWSNAGCVFGPSRTVAWRVLDAQYFGLAQRRRRVFVVASARSGFDPAAVLFECDGVRRDFAPSRKAGQDTAGTLASRTRAGGFPGTDEACSGYVQPVAGTLEASAGRSRRAGTPPAMLTPVICMAHGQGGAEIASERSPTLTCNHEAPIVVHGTQDPCVSRDTAFALGRNNGGENVIAFSCKNNGADASAISPTLRAMNSMTSNQNAGGQVAVVYGLPGNWIGRKPENGGNATEPPLELAPCLTATDRHAVAFAENSRAEVRLENGDGQIVGALSAGGGKPGQGTPCIAYGFQPRIARNGRGDMGDVIGALTAKSGETGKGDAAPCVATNMAVRRLTPRECERLQGTPDDYTLIPFGRIIRIEKLEADWVKYLLRGGVMTLEQVCRAAADGPRYKALGNSMAVHVMRWIGKRIQKELKA